MHVVARHLVDVAVREAEHAVRVLQKGNLRIVWEMKFILQSYIWSYRYLISI